MNVCNTLQQALINNVKKYAHLKHNKNMDEIAEYKKERNGNTSARKKTLNPALQRVQSHMRKHQRKDKVLASDLSGNVRLQEIVPRCANKTKKLNGQSSPQHVASIAVAK